MGSIAYHLLNEVKAHEDPLGPNNLLIFSMGPLTGAPFSRARLTGGFGEADAGGFWQVEVKKAGFDEILVRGEAKKPLWLWVTDGKAELRDASNLWGLEVAETEAKMREEAGEKLARTALIGPSGDKKVRIACIINDLNHVAGRNGLGAVMGSKKLKGIAVRGHNLPKLHQPERVAELAKTLISRIELESKSMHEYGTGVGLDRGVATGNLPTRNFRDGNFNEASKLDAKTIKETYRVGMGTCHACAVACKKEVKLETPYKVEPHYGGPEYETLGAFGSDCGISDLAAVCKANEICQRMGLDTISAGCTVAFAMECSENGIITKEDTGGLDLRFGNAEAMVKLTEMIAGREGIGEILAEGTMRAAEVFGKGADKYAIHVKGQEIPMHEPRLKKGLGLGYAISPTGADHCHNIHDTGMGPAAYESLKPLGIYEEAPTFQLTPEKVRLVKIWIEMKIAANSLSICQFPPWRFAEYIELLNAVTGWGASMHELVLAAQRTLNLARVFNVREGFKASDDWLPSRFFEPQTSGHLAQTAVDKTELSAAIKSYYGMMGWDEEGVPRLGTLQALGVGWAYEKMK